MLYLGDAGDKWMISEEAALRALGVVLDRHGKVPDLIVYHRKRNWLLWSRQ